VVVTDLMGYLEPCGCTSRPLGGIDRLTAKLRAIRADGIPTGLVLAGDLFFETPPDGTSATQDRWQAEAVADILADLDAVAAIPGTFDLLRGADVFEALRARADTPMLGAGERTREDTAPLLDHIVVDLAGRKVGIVGVSDRTPGDGTIVGLDHRLGDALAQAAARFAEADTALTVALVDGGRRVAREVARTAPSLDFVIVGGANETNPMAPASLGGPFSLHAARHGRGLTVVDVYLDGSGRLADASSWSLDEERARLEASAAELRTRITQWEAEGSAPAADLAVQRTRLAAMERDLADHGRREEVRGRRFAAAWHELPREAPGDTAVTAIMRRFDLRVNEHNRVAFAERRPRPAPAGTPHYVGSVACRPCHGAAVTWWEGHAHGRAFATLVEREKEFNMKCVGCHVTGYEEPGGSTVTHNLEGALVNVGCEVCHGAGSAHVASPEAHPPLRVDVTEALCMHCHNEEHSDTFLFERYRSSLIVPGHGRPVAGSP
jgi:hypothetical protein